MNKSGHDVRRNLLRIPLLAPPFEPEAAGLTRSTAVASWTTRDFHPTRRVAFRCRLLRRRSAPADPVGVSRPASEALPPLLRRPLAVNLIRGRARPRGRGGDGFAWRKRPSRGRGGNGKRPSRAGVYRDRLQADLVLSADGAQWRPDLVTVNVASRGIVSLNLSLTTAAKDLHSGRYGGTVANAAHALGRLVASFHDETGRVAVAGFYDDVRPPTRSEREAMAAIPFDEAAYLAAVGAAVAGRRARLHHARAPVAPPHARRQRSRLRLSGTRRQDRDPAQGASQNLVPAGAGSDARAHPHVAEAPLRTARAFRRQARVCR